MENSVDRLGLEFAEASLGEVDSSIKCMQIDEKVTAIATATATADDWRKTLHKVIPAVVVLHTTTVRAFDTEVAGTMTATGFVVDKRRGIILTNRHVVQPGPVVAEAIFLNQDEVPVHPIYRDPVHDFGFFRYDPSAIQFLNYEEIPLAPEGAYVGLEIRVVGNDSGEKLSILAGTLARLDRDAPLYNMDGYNDFNTFYMQAASGTKGGSSGSPVIDWQGRAVALNAGIQQSSSASAYFLPLERVVRALSFIQKGSEIYESRWKPVSIPRGTLQVTFCHKGFHETHRLGLQSETEQIVRHASPAGETGMLVVDFVVPGGPGYKHLEEGDVLIRVNGEVITHFVKLESLLDDSVKKNVELEIERGGTSKKLYLLVQDLHSVTPDYFFEVSGAVIHPLSYQQARNFCFQCGLVYVAKPGYMLFRAGVPQHAIIKKIAGKELFCIEELISVLAKLSRGTQVPLEYISYMDRHRSKSVLVTIDRHEWYAPPQIYTRDDSTGLWTAKPAFQPDSLFLSSGFKNLGNLVGQPVSVLGEHVCVGQFHHDNNKELADGITSMETNNEDVSEYASHHNASNGGVKKQVGENLSANGSVTDFSLNETRGTKLEKSMQDDVLMDNQGAGAATGAANASVAECVIEPTLVRLEVHVPLACSLDAVHSQQFSGTGVIIHHSHDIGLVAVDKNTVVTSASDVVLSFAAFPVEIPGEIVFIHPVHNYALVSYDPSALGPVGASVVRAAELLPEPALRRGDFVYLVGLKRSLQAASIEAVVTNPCDALNVGSADIPRYRATNMEVIELATDFGSTFSGVLTDEQGRVQAIWGSFSTQLISGSNTSESEVDQFVRGIPIYAINQVLDKILSGTNGSPLLINGVKRPMPLVRILEVELYPTLLSKARSFGLSDDWIQVLLKRDPVRKQVLCVKGCLAGSKAENLLKQGDAILAINREPVTCFRDIENACQALDRVYTNDGKLHMTIFRQGQEIDLFVGTDVRDGNGTTRAVNWCGCIVQYPHPEIRALGFLPEEGHGVYVTRWLSGSPVERYGLYACQWIVEVNGKPTPNLDAFIDVTKDLKHGEFVRVRTVQLDGKKQVQTLKQDLHYWPTWEMRFDPDTAIWHRNIINALDSTTV